MGIEAALPPGLLERIRKMIRDEVGKLLRSGFLRSASIGEGGLTLRGGFLRVFAPDGAEPSFYVGRIINGASGAYLGTGMMVEQPDGTNIAIFRTAEGDFGSGSIAEIRDGAGRVVLATDAASGQGLARPYVPGAFYLSRHTDWPKVSSTAFETVYRARMKKQQPTLLVQAWGTNDTSSATGEIRVLVNGVQMGGTQSTVWGAVNAYYFGPEAVAGDHMVDMSVEIQARMVSGSGAVLVGPAWVEGRQS